MVAIPLDKIIYNKVSKYANVLIFKEFYPKTKNVSYYLNSRAISLNSKAMQVSFTQVTFTSNSKVSHLIPMCFKEILHVVSFDSKVISLISKVV